MTISARVKEQFFASTSPVSERLIRLPPTVMTQYARENGGELPATTPRKRAALARRRRTNLWTVEEHERFLEGLERFPLGPWKEISALVGTKTTRQTMTHAQKYRQKIERRLRIGSLDIAQDDVISQGHHAAKTPKRIISKRVEEPEPACSVSTVGGSPLTGDAFDDEQRIFEDGGFWRSLLEEIEPEWRSKPIAASAPYESVYSF